MAIMLQTAFEIVRVEFEMCGITRCNGLQIVEVMNAMYKVTIKPKESRKGQSECYPNKSPSAGFLD